MAFFDFLKRKPAPTPARRIDVAPAPPVAAPAVPEPAAPVEADALPGHDAFRAEQEAGFAASFDLQSKSSSLRAAEAIVERMARP